MAWTVLAEYGGNFFVLESGGTTQGYSEEVLKMLSMRAKRWNVTQVVIEVQFRGWHFCCVAAAGDE